MIIGIGHRRSLFQDVGIDNLAQKDGMGGRLHFIDHFTGDVCLYAVGHGKFSAHLPRKICKLVGILGRREPEFSDELRIAVLGEDADGKISRCRHAFVGIVIVIERNGDRRRRRRDLHGTVCNAADGTALIPARAKIYAVGEIVKCFLIHRKSSKKLSRTGICSIIA